MKKGPWGVQNPPARPPEPPFFEPNPEKRPLVLAGSWARCMDFKKPGRPPPPLSGHPPPSREVFAPKRLKTGPHRGFRRGPFAVSASEWNFVPLFFWPFYPLLARHFRSCRSEIARFSGLHTVFMTCTATPAVFLNHKCSFGLRVEFCDHLFIPFWPFWPDLARGQAHFRSYRRAMPRFGGLQHGFSLTLLL